MDGKLGVNLMRENRGLTANLIAKKKERINFVLSPSKILTKSYLQKFSISLSNSTASPRNILQRNTSGQFLPSLFFVASCSLLVARKKKP